jgi:protein-tyrosine phosphatase
MTVGVLFVCLGNICRSPTAHGVFETLVAQQGLQRQIVIESAGTSDWHIGKPPDRRSQQAAERRGYDLSHLRARQVCPEDFHRFDYLLAMDADNLSLLQAMRPAGFAGELQLFLDYASDVSETDVPDPYYGGADGFDRVLDLTENAAMGLLRNIRQRLSR